MNKDLLYIVLLLVIAPIAFILMPFVGVLCGAIGFMLILLTIYNRIHA